MALEEAVPGSCNAPFRFFYREGPEAPLNFLHQIPSPTWFMDAEVNANTPVQRGNARMTCPDKVAGRGQRVWPGLCGAREDTSAGV